MDNATLPAWEDPSYYASIRSAESGGNDGAVNRMSGATGRYQFMPKTWAGMMRRYPTLGLSVNGRTDPDQQERAIKAFTRDNAKSLERQGVGVTKGTLYAAHFLGSGDAPKVLKASDDTLVSDLVAPVVITQNPHLRGMTAAGFRAWADKKGGRSAGDRNNETVSFGDVRPSKPVTDLEVNAPTESNQSALSVAGDAVRAEWSMLWAFQGASGLAPDPDFRADAQLLQDKAKQFGIPSSRLDYLASAHSAEHLDYLGQQYREDARREQRLADAGGMGLGMRIGAALFDPAAWAAAAGIGAVTGGTGIPAVIAARFGRAGTVALTAAEGALGNVSTDAIIAVQKPITDDDMLLWSAGAGLVMGGAFGALRKNPNTQLQADAMERVGRAIQGHVDGTAPVNLPGSAGAARASPLEPLRLDTDDLRKAYGDIDTGGVALDRIRFDLAAQFGSSESPVTRALGQSLVADSVGKKNRGMATPIAAEEVQKLLQTNADNIWQRDMQAAYREYAERNGLNWYERDRQRGDFGEQVTAFVRNQDPLREFDPAVAKAGQSFRRVMDSWVDHANNPGLVLGTSRRPLREGGLDKNPNYAPRIFSSRNVQETFEKYGTKQTEELVARAMMEANEELAEKAARKYARLYLKRVRQIPLGQDVAASRALAGEDLEELRRILTDETEVDAKDIEAIIQTVAPRPKESDASRMKHRLGLNEDFGLNLTNNKTGQVEYVRFSAFLENDADTLMSMYNRNMSGLVALAGVRIKNPRGSVEGGDELLIDGLQSQAQFSKALEQLKAVSDQIGHTPDAYKRDVDRLQFVRDQIAGVPHPLEGEDFGQFLRMMRDYNFVRVMGQVGFAQIPELASIAGQLGIKAMMQGVPKFRTLVRNARTGAIDDDLSEELELLTGTGTDWLRGSAHTKWDDFGNPLTLTGNNPYLVGADNVLRKGKRLTSAVSGLAPMNTLLQRWVSRAMANKFAQYAAGEAPNMNRLRTLGLDDKMLERITAEIKAKSTFVKGEVSGRNLRRLNVDQWDDPEVASAFTLAMFRASRRIIQENDVGQMMVWMSHPLAKTLLQFRSFVIGAWTKQFVHNVHMRDFETFTTFTSSLLAGALTYIGQTHLQTLGASDRQETLKKRLTEGAIAKAALQRSSWFSLFGMAGDTAGMAVGAGPIFDARTTGLPSNVLWGNPTMDLGDSIVKATGSLVQGAVTGEGTQAGVKNVTRTLPLQNFMPFVALSNVLIGDLPRRD